MVQEYGTSMPGVAEDVGARVPQAVRQAKHACVARHAGAATRGWGVKVDSGDGTPSPRVLGDIVGRESCLQPVRSGGCVRVVGPRGTAPSGASSPLAGRERVGGPGVLPPPPGVLSLRLRFDFLIGEGARGEEGGEES